MNVLSARWFRALAVVVLSLVLLWLSSNRIVVLLGNNHFEPTYRLCVAGVGWLAEDVSLLERQIVCNVTMAKMVADAERELETQ